MWNSKLDSARDGETDIFSASPKLSFIALKKKLRLREGFLEKFKATGPLKFGKNSVKRALF